MSERAHIPAVDIASRSDPGRDPDKQVNEDSVGHAETPLGLLAVVCDGMGGHAGGKEASELALATILDGVKSAPANASPKDVLRVAIEEANRRVFAMPTAETGLRPGSTVVAALAHAGGIEIAHVGDSRVYLVHAGAISQVTKDHSMVQEMVDRNIIRAEDAASHPDANKIMRALGIAKDCDVDTRAESIAYVTGDVLVLCSDGLSDLVGASEILEIAGSRPPAQAAGQLVDLANARGGHDNVTATVLRMKASATASASSTIVKTVPVTQAIAPAPEAAPADRGSGPRGTLIAGPVVAPASSSPGSATVPAMPAIAPAIPPAPTRSSHPAPDPRSRLPVVVGLALAIVAAVLGGIFVWSEQQPRHHAVPIVDPPAEAGAVTTAAVQASPEAGAAPEPELTGAPPLEPPICAKARAARERGSPVASRLEAACRAAGGTLGAGAGPAPSGGDGGS